MSWRRLGFCWVCVLGTVAYDAPCDWWVCDRCGVVATTAEAEARRGTLWGAELPTRRPPISQPREDRGPHYSSPP